MRAPCLGPGSHAHRLLSLVQDPPPPPALAAAGEQEALLCPPPLFCCKLLSGSPLPLAPSLLSFPGPVIAE